MWSPYLSFDTALALTQAFDLSDYESMDLKIVFIGNCTACSRNSCRLEQALVCKTDYSL